MTVVHALCVLAIALGQAEPEAAPPPSEGATRAPAPAGEPKMRLAPPRLVPLDRADPAGKEAPRALVQEGAPALRPDRTTRCFERAAGGGRWRAQCDAATKTCLVAPDAELSADGAPVAGLERAPPCLAPGWREDDLASQGYTFVDALAEAPPGWQRDERQRVMQVNFDLNRRIWLGAGYGAGSLPGSDAGEATLGVRWDVPFRLARAPALARVRALESFASFSGDATEFTLVGVDASRAYPSPLLRFTTFVGRPRRFDPPLYVGGWVEAVRVESLRTGVGWHDRTEVGAAALTVDLWRSRDLASFVRLRGGAGYEVTDQLDGGAWVPHAALDLDLSLDGGGFHHLRLTALSEWLVTTGDYQPEDPAVPRLPEHRTRLTGKVEYELVVAAVNDQPISLVLDGRAQRRDDVPGLDDDWHGQGTASLRFSLWAPARRGAPVQEKL